MPAVICATSIGTHNENESYSNQYLSEVLGRDIRATVDRWRDEAGIADGRTPYDALQALARGHVPFCRNDVESRGERRRSMQRDWRRELLAPLRYDWNPANHPLDDGDVPVVLCAPGGKPGVPDLPALSAYDARAKQGIPSTLKPHRLQFQDKAPPPDALPPGMWNDGVARHVLRHDHPPRCLRLSFSSALLVERGQWPHNPLSRFAFEEMLGLRKDATLKSPSARALLRTSPVLASGWCFHTEGRRALASNGQMR